MGHQGPYRTAMTIRQRIFIHNLMNKVKRYIKACHTCLKTKPKYKKIDPFMVEYHRLCSYARSFHQHQTHAHGFWWLPISLVITCDQTNFTIFTPLRSRDAQSVAEALIYKVIYLFGPPRQIICCAHLSLRATQSEL